MDATTTERFAELLRDGQDRITQNWTRTIAATLRGRLSEAEMSSQVHELYGAVRTAADAGGELTLSSPACAELRAVLGDLSRHRARHGFTTTETAVSVF
ncbi:MAG TPA: RsbRD N-terminal domain-containing protein, partial [Micromonosporaceae bacterium]|nr:RsbRD N-terminal domain-containing protein [Micromonosporaceae bacterium]